MANQNSSIWDIKADELIRQYTLSMPKIQRLNTELMGAVGTANKEDNLIDINKRSIENAERLILIKEKELETLRNEVKMMKDSVKTLLDSYSVIKHRVKTFKTKQMAITNPFEKIVKEYGMYKNFISQEKQKQIYDLMSKFNKLLVNNDRMMDAV